MCNCEDRPCCGCGDDRPEDYDPRDDMDFNYPECYPEDDYLDGSYEDYQGTEVFDDYPEDDYLDGSYEEP